MPLSDANLVLITSQAVTQTARAAPQPIRFDPIYGYYKIVNNGSATIYVSDKPDALAQDALSIVAGGGSDRQPFTGTLWVWSVGPDTSFTITPANLEGSTITAALTASSSSDSTTGQGNATSITAALAAVGTGGTVKISSPGTYYLAKPTANTDACVQASGLSGVALELGQGVVLKLADGANCYLGHFQNCTDLTITGGSWDSNPEGGNTASGLVWFAGWPGHTVWLDGCSRFRIANTKMLSSPSTGAGNVKYAIWVTGNSTSNAAWSDGTIQNVDCTTYSDGIHILGPGSRLHIDNVKGLCRDNMVGVGTEDYMVQQCSYGSVSDITVTNIHSNGSLQEPFRLFGRNSTEGTGATRVTAKRIAVKGIFGINHQLNIVSATNASPIVCTTATPHYLKDQQAGIIVSGGTGNTAVNGTGLTITRIDSTTFSINGSTGNGTYNANTAYVTTGAAAASIVDDSSQSGRSISTTFTTSGNVPAGNSVTFTPAAMSGGSGGTYWAIVPGTTLTIDSAGAQETVVVQSVTATTFTVWSTTKAHNGSGLAITGTSVAGLTALEVDEITLKDVKCQTSPSSLVVNLTGTAMKSVTIDTIHISGTKGTSQAAIGGGGNIVTLAVNNLTADPNMAGWGIDVGGGTVNHLIVRGARIFGTGQSHRLISASGPLTNLTVSDVMLDNCHSFASFGSGLSVNTSIVAQNILITNGNWGINLSNGTGNSPVAFLSNIKASVNGLFRIGGAATNAITAHGQNVSASTVVSRTSTQQLRLNGACFAVDGALLTGPAQGDQINNTNAGASGFSATGVHGYTGAAWTKLY